MSLTGHAAEVAAPTAMSTDAIINLPLADAWALFTTAPGLTLMGYEKAQVDLRLGGRVHAEHTVNHELMDAEVASFEPQRMLSLKRENAAWSVLYFQAMGQDMTGIRWVELAPAAQAQSLQALAQSHRELFNRLIRRYAPECELCKKEREAAENAEKP